MHQNKKKALADKLNFVITHNTDPALFLEAPGHKKAFTTEGGVICIVEDAYTEFNKINKMLESEPGWREKFSNDYLEKEIQKILGRILKDSNTDKADVYLDDLITQCENYNVEYTVYLPVDGVNMLVDRVDLGKITLTNMRGKQFEDYIKQAEAQIMNCTPNQEDNQRHLHIWQRDVLPLLKDRVVAIYTTVAEPTRAQERAEEEFSRVLDILRYFLFSAFQKSMEFDIGLNGNVHHGIGTAAIISADYQVFHTPRIFKGPRPFEITQEIVDAMQRVGVQALAEMLHPDNKTDFSETLFAGIHWVANAHTQADPANEFLSLASCLETFLTRSKTDIGSITNAVAGGVGWVLGHNYQDRLNLHKEVKNFYEKRSTISHGGKQEDLSSHLPRLRDIVGAFILEMVRRRDDFAVGGKQALHDWIDQGPMRPDPSI